MQFAIDYLLPLDQDFILFDCYYFLVSKVHTYRHMISTKVNIRKSSMSTSINEAMKKNYGVHQQQNSIKNYLLSRLIVNKHLQSTNIEVKKDKVKENQVNDENCSFNANIAQNISQLSQDKFKIQNPSFIKFQNQSTSQNLDQINCSQRLTDQTSKVIEEQISKATEQQISKVINLKKKIKKCDHSNPSYNFFREKVTFKKKIYKLTSNIDKENVEIEDKIELGTQKQNRIQVQQGTQTFFIYRDSQVFTSLKSKQLRNKIVPQRMDNDTETDDEQVQRFVKRMSTDFVQYIQKVKNQNLINQEGQKFQSLQEEEQ